MLHPEGPGAGAQGPRVCPGEGPLEQPHRTTHRAQPGTKSPPAKDSRAWVRVGQGAEGPLGWGLRDPQGGGWETPGVVAGGPPGWGLRDPRGGGWGIPGVGAGDPRGGD